MQDKELVNFVINALEDFKAQDIATIDVQRKSSITDFMVICTGTSNRHVASIADKLVMAAKEADILVLGSEGKSDSDWVVVDCDSVIVHIMQAESRALYELEKLWG